MANISKPAFLRTIWLLKDYWQYSTISEWWTIQTVCTWIVKQNNQKVCYLGEIKLTSDFCPRCNALRNMVMTSTVRVITDPNGEKKIIKTNHFHCDTCNSFVRSEDIDRKVWEQQAPMNEKINFVINQCLSVQIRVPFNKARPNIQKRRKKNWISIRIKTIKK